MGADHVTIQAHSLCALTVPGHMKHGLHCTAIMAAAQQGYPPAAECAVWASQSALGGGSSPLPAPPAETAAQIAAVCASQASTSCKIIICLPLQPSQPSTYGAAGCQFAGILLQLPASQFLVAADVVTNSFELCTAASNRFSCLLHASRGQQLHSILYWCMTGRCLAPTTV